MALDGALAEWLGRGLQSLVRRFESARRLLQKRRRLAVVLVTLAAAAGAVGCGGKESTPAMSGSQATQPLTGTALHRIRQRIEQLGGQESYPVVPLDLFFKGNQDPASFAPNLSHTPEMPA